MAWWRHEGGVAVAGSGVGSVARRGGRMEEGGGWRGSQIRHLEGGARWRKCGGGRRPAWDLGERERERRMCLIDTRSRGPLPYGYVVS